MRPVCPICPHACRLAEGDVGACHARACVAGEIVPLAYGKPCSLAIDPIEKKPLFHCYPGTQILSLGMAGCNLHCLNCQNSGISQANPLELPFHELAPDALVPLMQTHGLNAVAYTYTEPLVAYEYVRDCARHVKEAGGINVLVTAAYVNPAPLKALLPYIDAANVDIKTMENAFMRAHCGATLDPVLKALRLFKEANVMLEVTHLVLPHRTNSDDTFKRLADFVVQELGPEVPVHFSRFFPAHRCHDWPPTPVATLERAKHMATSAGLRHVYLGNVGQSPEASVCTHCGATLIVREGYAITHNSMTQGACPHCQTPVYGRF